MSFDELASLFRKAADSVESNIPDIVVRGFSDGIALIQERIQTEGKNADGAPHKPYTEAYLKFKQDPKRYKRGRQLGLGSSRYTGVVDYTLTTELFSDIKVISQKFGPNEYGLTIGATKQVNKDKLESLGKRDGETIRLSKSEIERVSENIENEILELINQVFQ